MKLSLKQVLVKLLTLAQKQVGYIDYVTPSRQWADRGTATYTLSNLPDDVTVLGVWVYSTPNPHWVRAIINVRESTKELVIYFHNEYTDPISGSWFLRIVYRRN